MLRLLLVLLLASASFAGGDALPQASQPSISKATDTNPYEVLQGYLIFIGAGLGISFMFNTARYMLAKASGDEGNIARTKASIINSFGASLLIGGIFIGLLFIEETAANAFGAAGYGDMINKIGNDLEELNSKLQDTITIKTKELRNELKAAAYTISVFGVTTSSGGCSFGDEECIGRRIERRMVLSTIIERAMDVQLAVIVAKAAFDFFLGNNYNAAGFLLMAGLAYYSLDISRSAGAAMIAVALGAFYAYPVAYEAFLNLPKFPEIEGQASQLLDIDSQKFCSLDLIPSVKLSETDVAIDIIQTEISGSPAAFALSNSSLISFLNSLYFNFLLRHGVALSVTLLFIHHLYLVLSGGVPGSFLTGRLGALI